MPELSKPPFDDDPTRLTIIPAEVDASFVGDDLALPEEVTPEPPPLKNAWAPNQPHTPAAAPAPLSAVPGHRSRGSRSSATALLVALLALAGALFALLVGALLAVVGLASLVAAWWVGA